jgi:hypothetical protein
MEQTSYIFRDEHRPNLTAGQYELTASWIVSVKEQTGGLVKKASKDQTVEFFVAGERFSLKPADIHSVYPPEGGRGSYHDCLPHTALARDTLPWERAANKDKAPWLALLVLHEDEAAQHKLKTIKVDDYGKSLPTMDNDGKPLPAAYKFNAKEGNDKPDSVQVIELPAAWIPDLLPNVTGLSTLCHVRAKGAEETDESVAVVVSPRLPAHGLNTVHLVSLENRYFGTVFNCGRQATITLASLKSWSFTCETPNQNDPESEPLEKIFSNLKASWLRLPPEIAKNSHARTHTSSGFLPVPHRFRTGECGVSWYSGPLVPAGRPSVSTEAVKLPAKFADELLWYEQNLGMLTITYAAAWELGRMLALQNRRIQMSLQNWRREQIRHAQAMAAAQHSQCNHLPQVQRACPCRPIKPPAELTAWLDGLRLLQGVPFKYLVPDERMLPKESIRFFRVDSQWTDALIDGGLSVARTPTEHKQCCEEAERALINSSKSLTISGFLLRSTAVAGWPGLNVIAKGVDETNSANETLTLFPPQQLSPSILLCLCNGQITSLSVHQPHETLHLSIGGTPNPAIWKSTTMIWKHETKRILDISALNNTSSSDFANKMLHQQQKLRISVSW